MIVAVALLLLVAVVLMISSAGKVVRPGEAMRPLVEIGVARPLALLVVALSIAVEQGVATSLIAWPRAVEARVAALALFSIFAIVGVTALAAGRTIECGCFGSLHRSALGWPQIVQFIVAAPILIAGGQFAPRWPAPGTSLASLLMAQATVCLTLLMAGVRTWMRLRRNRISYARTSISAARLSQVGAGVPSR